MRPGSRRFTRRHATSCRPSSPPGLDRLTSGPTCAARPCASTPSARVRRSPGATELIPAVRAVAPVEGITTQVGGLAASGHDFMVWQAQPSRTPSPLTLAPAR